MNAKMCSRCKETKSVTEFGKMTNNADGLQSYCKQCQADYKREYRKRTNYGYKYRQRNKDKLKEYSQQYAERNNNTLSKKAKEKTKEFVKIYGKREVSKSVRNKLISNQLAMGCTHCEKCGTILDKSNLLLHHTLTRQLVEEHKLSYNLARSIDGTMLVCRSCHSIIHNECK